MRSAGPSRHPRNAHYPAKGFGGQMCMNASAPSTKESAATP